MEDKHSNLVSEPPLSYVATTNPEAQPFRLFDLPDELWVRIGKMVIDDTPAIKVSKVTIRPALEPSLRNTFSSKGHGIDLNPPAILQTCSALRRELRAQYYRHKVTVVTSVYIASTDPWTLSAISKLGGWLLMIGPDARKDVRGFCYGNSARRGGAIPTAPGCGAGRWGMGRWELEMMLTPKRSPASESETFDRVDWEIKFL